MKYKIVYLEREFAKSMGDPVLAIVEASSPRDALKLTTPNSYQAPVMAVPVK